MTQEKLDPTQAPPRVLTLESLEQRFLRGIRLDTDNFCDIYRRLERLEELTLLLSTIVLGKDVRRKQDDEGSVD